MKKLISLLLALTLCLSLAACGGSASSTPASTGGAPASSGGNDAPAAASDAAWPTDTVEVYVPAAAGSALDLNCRVILESLTKSTGENFVVINEETGNGAVAYETVRNAAPDGKTLMYTQNIFIQYYGDVYNEYPFDVVDAVAPGGDPLAASYVVAIGKDRPYTTWEELVAYAKEHPGEVKCGIQNGGMAHLMSAIMCDQAGIEVLMVESGGSTEKITNIMGGMIDFAMIAATTAVPYVESGDLIVAAQTAPERSELYPDWPTTTELGYPDVQVLTQSAFYVPKNMDEGLKQAINQTFASVEADAAAQENLASLTVTYVHYSIDEIVQKLNDSAQALKEGYELTGSDMSNKK